MEKMISKCGLDCAECGAFKSWKNDDNNMRKKTAEEWSRQFGANIAPETINCQGCQAEGKDAVVFSHCNVCGIRICAMEKGLKDCSACEDFGCEKVSEIWKHVPEAKKVLEALRA